ncbi:MAG: prepilin peptidase [Mogibacterium sp.]|nr:prepilin peptidase [Mogibacterium sp.]
MGYNIELILRIVTAIALAVLFGNGSVVAFNRMDRSWFLDYEEGAGDELKKVLPPKLIEAEEAGRQRLPSSPWKYAFTGYFAICGIYLAVRGGSLAYEISVLCVFFIMLEMAIADQLYQVVPDQLSIALAVTAVAFIGYHDKWWEPAAGALLGLGITLVIFLLGQLLFRTGSIGGADIKFFAAIGLVSGRTGVAVIFILTTLLFAVYSVIRIASGRGSIKDRNPMLPSAAAAVTIYFLFLWNLGELITLEL